MILEIDMKDCRFELTENLIRRDSRVPPEIWRSNFQNN